ncbi:MAG TPA: putative toxin-antitoxin system toxin component, PIN family [Mucilaginibacter sp.]|nr:putative toxin-antitoxin system toxin component, PIN family [Mucilaginibacter sp.]
MQKVILDTNVVVSALIQKSFPYLIVYNLYIERKIQLCLSEELMTEYYEVLKRDKFSRFPDFTAMANLVLKDIHEHALFFKPEHKLQIIKDIDDNMLLELAEASEADYLVTGNTNDFTMSSFLKTRIVSPREFWRISG